MLFKKLILLCLVCCFPLVVLAEVATWPQTLDMNGVKWTQGDKQENDDMIIVEYVIPGEKVDDWTQLFTIQQLKFKVRSELTPKLFAESEATELSSNPKQEVWNKILESNDAEAIWEFRILSPKAEQQNEIQRIAKSKEGVITILHYVKKTAVISDEERAKWIAILKNIPIN